MAPLSVSLALWAAFAAAFALSLSHFGHTGHLRLFDAAGAVLYAVTAFYAAFVAPGAAAAETSIVIVPGLLAAIIWSMASGRPFTAEYPWLARKHDPDVIIRAHTILTALWATLFAALALIVSLTVVLHSLPPGWTNVLSLLLFVAMLIFTWRGGLYIDNHRGRIPLLMRR